MNTYGLGPFSVRENAFPLPPRASPKTVSIRNNFILALKIHNVILSLFGYNPITAPISGCIRIATGFSMCVGSFLPHFTETTKKELLATGLTQVTRGALEAFLPFGFVLNIVLDIQSTTRNCFKALKN